ncbi:MAG: transglutaminase-like domain-containing protein, partial [Clostridiales bacterium]|nr:transglutaminase-like domain-containing protein [Clostridiales bacterium]
MLGIKALGGQGKKTEGEVSLAAFLFMFSGGYGVLRFASSLKNFYFNVQVAVLVSVAICVVMWLVFSLSRRFFWWISLEVIMGALAVSFIGNAFWQQMANVANSFFGAKASAPMDITLLVIVLECLFLYFVFFCELSHKWHWIAYILITVIMLVTPLLGIELDYGAVVMLGLFQFGFWAIHVSKYRCGPRRAQKGQWHRHWLWDWMFEEDEKLDYDEDKKLDYKDCHVSKYRCGPRRTQKGQWHRLWDWMFEEAEKRDCDEAEKLDYKVSFTSQGRAPKNFVENLSAITIVSFVAATLIALILMANYHESIYKAVNTVEGFIVRAIKKMSEEFAQSEDGGEISRGNQYPAGTKHLLVETDRQPKQTLYLRGFVGREYIGGEWIAANDTALYANAEKKLGLYTPGIASKYGDKIYYALNHITHPESSMQLNIMRFVDNYTGYEPYYSRAVQDPPGDPGYDEYDYDFFEQADMDVNWEAILTDYTDYNEEAAIYEKLQRAYIEENQVPYTQVPTKLLPRLTALVKENPLEDLNEITAFILYTLHSNATYSLTPGWAPLDRDIAEYFLFDNGYGYCQHFALTATLLYRLYGVPARYATGYMISPGAFELGENERYQAVVTDESAHAWTEIFLEDYGWTVVDATPSSDGSTIASYPGFDEAELKGVLKEKNWDMNVRNQLRIGENTENIDND